MEAVGTHCILELYGCPLELLDDPSYIQRTLSDAVDRSGATLLSMQHHRFEPQGVTCLGLLSESHISIHTWPEKGYAAIDVFTCGDVAMPHRACDHLIESFRSQKHSLKTINRAMQVGRQTPDMPMAVQVSS